MPKVTTVVDVKVVMEMTLEEARHVHTVLSRGAGTGVNWDIFDALDTALVDLALPTKGVE